MELPPLARNLSDTAAAGVRSQCARNSSAVPVFSGDQIADKSGDCPSNVEAKSFIAAGLARQIVLASSTSSAGQPAFSNPKTASDFIITSSGFQLTTPNLFLNPNLPEP